MSAPRNDKNVGKGRPIKPGDFVIINGNREENVYAVRSIQDDGVIIIYPLDDQRDEKRLIWGGNGEGNRRYIEGVNGINELEFIAYDPFASYVDRPEEVGNPNNVPNNEEFWRYVYSNDHFVPENDIEEIYDNLSNYRITEQQYINALSLMIQGYGDELSDITISSQQVRWLFMKGLFPPTHDFFTITDLKDLDLDFIKRIGQISRPTNVQYYSSMMEEYSQAKRLGDDELAQDVLSIFQYIADMGVIPDESAMRHVAYDDNLIPLLKIWVERNLIQDPQKLINMARESGNDEAAELLLSSYQPIKSAMKR